MSLSQQPVELQNTAAPKFGVAHGALANGQVKADLRSLKAGLQAVFPIAQAVVYLVERFNYPDHGIIDGGCHLRIFAGHETLFLGQLFFAIWGVLYLSITQQPIELQNTAAPIFGVAYGALANGQVKVDLRSL